MHVQNLINFYKSISKIRNKIKIVTSIKVNAKFEENRLKTLKRKRSVDGRMDGHPNVERYKVIPRHLRDLCGRVYKRS